MATFTTLLRLARRRAGAHKSASPTSFASRASSTEVHVARQPMGWWKSRRYFVVRNGNNTFIVDVQRLSRLSLRQTGGLFEIYGTRDNSEVILASFTAERAAVLTHETLSNLLAGTTVRISGRSIVSYALGTLVVLMLLGSCHENRPSSSAAAPAPQAQLPVPGLLRDAPQDLAPAQANPDPGFYSRDLSGAPK